MRAFLSYGLRNDEMYWVSVLAEQLQKRGFEVVAPNYLDEKSYHSNINSIFSSHLYLGILTEVRDSQRILFEFKNALVKIPSLLIIDENLYGRILSDSANIITPRMIEKIISLNRRNYNLTIAEINSRIEKIKNDYSNNNLAWLIGGAAFIALLSILSKNK